MEMKIILAEEYPLIRAGIKLLIESVEGAEVAGETGDGEACLEMVKDLREKEVGVEKPALLLLITELYLPGKSGFEILKEIKRDMQEVRVLVLTVCRDMEYFRKAMDMEADGYLRKDAEPSELARAFRMIKEGKKYFQTQNWKSSQIIENNKWKTLTRREREVLLQTAEGKLNKEIADSLSISERTVKNHLSSIFRKLEVCDRTQAAILAIGICGIPGQGRDRSI